MILTQQHAKYGTIYNKPWWTDILTDKWKELRKCEKIWSLCRGVKKKQCKADMCAAQRSLDREVQRCKRKYWLNQQLKIQDMCNSNDVQFWKKIGTIGIKSERRSQVPFEVLLPNGEVSNKKEVVLDVWKSSFSDLLNGEMQQSVCNVNDGGRRNVIDDDMLDDDITIPEIIKSLENANKGKAVGIDDIPVEVLFNDQCIQFMLSLFNKCYESGIYPSMWKMGMINPIPKGSTQDVRNPTLYRGITLAVASYKLFCGVINNRLQIFAEKHGLICEEQNGFRKGRSCTDHIMSLVNVVESRIKKKQSTLAAFIDFKKAYDSINRDLLWN